MLHLFDPPALVAIFGGIFLLLDPTVASKHRPFKTGRFANIEYFTDAMSMHVIIGGFACARVHQSVYLDHYFLGDSITSISMPLAVAIADAGMLAISELVLSMMFSLS